MEDLPKQDKSIQNSQVTKTPDANRDANPNRDDVAASSQLILESARRSREGDDGVTVHRDNTPFEHYSTRKRVTPRTYSNKKAKRRRIEVANSQTSQALALSSPVADNVVLGQVVGNSHTSSQPRHERRPHAETELTPIKLSSTDPRTLSPPSDGIEPPPTPHNGQGERVESSHPAGEPRRKRREKKRKKHSTQPQPSDSANQVPAISGKDALAANNSTVDRGVPANDESAPATSTTKSKSKKRRREPSEEPHSVKSQATTPKPERKKRKRSETVESSSNLDSRQPNEHSLKVEDYVVYASDVEDTASKSEPKKRKSTKAVDPPDERGQTDSPAYNRSSTTLADASAQQTTAGPFQPWEIEVLASAVERYRDDNLLTQHELNEMIQNTERPTERAGLWNELAQALPNRTRQSIMKVTRRRWHNYEKRGKWDPEEDEALRAAQELKPNKWKAIGAMIGRMPEDCRDRWRNYLKCGENRRKDVWTEQEEMELIRIVNECMTALHRAQREEQLKEGMANGQTVTDLETSLNWNVVSEKLGGQRSRLQCTYKWKQLQQRKAAEDHAAEPVRINNIENNPSWRVQSGKESYKRMLPGDKYTIVCAIAESGTYKEKRIPWKLIAQGHPESRWTTADRKVALDRMKRLVPEQTSLQDLLAALKTYFEKHHADQLQDFYTGTNNGGAGKRKIWKSEEFVRDQDDEPEMEVHSEPPAASDTKAKTLSPAAKAYAAKKAKV